MKVKSRGEVRSNGLAGGEDDEPLIAVSAVGQQLSDRSVHGLPLGGCLDLVNLGDPSALLHEQVDEAVVGDLLPVSQLGGTLLVERLDHVAVIAEVVDGAAGARTSLPAREFLPIPVIGFDLRSKLIRFELAGDRGIRCVTLDYEGMKGIESGAPRLF